MCTQIRQLAQLWVTCWISIAKGSSLVFHICGQYLVQVESERVVTNRRGACVEARSALFSCKVILYQAIPIAHTLICCDRFFDLRLFFVPQAGMDFSYMTTNLSQGTQNSLNHLEKRGAGTTKHTCRSAAILDITWCTILVMPICSTHWENQYLNTV